MLLEITTIPEDDTCTVTLALTNMVAHAANKRASQPKNGPGPDLMHDVELDSAQLQRMRDFHDGRDRWGTT